MRKEILFNDGWVFEMPGEAPVPVTVPHTWNGTDGQDGGNDYKRLVCKYTKKFHRPAVAAGGVCQLVFKGVNNESVVTLNGNEVCRHAGGYSTFVADLTPYLQDENVLEVTADNTDNERVYPQKADFTFYGGIYRDVVMEILPKNHFTYGEYASPPLRVTAGVSGTDGTVMTDVTAAGEGTVWITVLDGAGMIVASGAAGEPLTVKDAHLWNGTLDPYLYTVRADLVVGEEVQDTVTCKTGFRSFSVDPDKGFILNGKEYPLRGVCRHQDRPGLGNAIGKAEHEEDIAIIREIGANTIRLAHYQHDQYFYDLCDRYGLVIWAEIPYISRHVASEEANANTESQLRELILQCSNHPCIVVWGISNEITMFKADKKDMVENHKRLNDLCHQLDPTRLTTLACYAMCMPWDKTAHITDIVSWNLYLGWYTPFFFLNKAWFALFRFLYPKRCIGMSEYGAEAMVNLHSVKPKRGDNTEEYQAKYHEYMAKFFAERPYFWATHIWNMFDFAADGRNQGGEPGRNHKGLVTFDRKTRKDSFYIYKAYWSDEPFVHVCGHRFVNRTGSTVEVRVYSNQKKIALYNNGKLVEEKEGDKVFVFRLPMQDRNEIKAVSGDLEDEILVCHVDKIDPAYTEENLGSSASWQV